MSSTTIDATGPVGIGGWLVLPFLGLLWSAYFMVSKRVKNTFVR